ncbi:MAG TPA: G1 family glutamic endopeptidase [Solirubrobacteraceae bacterium]|nr:G1 family glutamic endopeptidase [Solirubrobacteraceae bacterium]
MKRGLIGMLVLAAGLTAAPAALAAKTQTTQSTNWAGYAVHQDGVSFHRISASWTQPTASCTAGQPSYSSAWVGLGGYSPTSNALEQIGTELDCTASGKVVSSAWYELVPAPSRTISLVVQPGDVMHADVTVTGHRVVVELDNLTRHHRFRKTLHSPAIDVSSAEWILEAPSECISQYSCQALPLANFGSITFDSASVVTAHGRAGTIARGDWSRTRIKLTPGAQRLIVSRDSTDTGGEAVPSALRGGGRAFDVTFATAPAQTRRAYVSESRLRTGYLEH